MSLKIIQTEVRIEFDSLLLIIKKVYTSLYIHDELVLALISSLFLRLIKVF